MYEIEIHEAAEAELDTLRPYDRNRILDDIEEQLEFEPGLVTRRKKVLEAVEPPWDQLGPVWQLSVGDFRVFYDIVEKDRLVIVRAVRKKPAHRTTDEIQ
ncbi:MAG TPA: type II toxin-antitoxin system RelE/ParE family toxin [Vicinamibacteria bacterium]|nr:type II toxin-antitoxin system RelE/ParE family toxin [Vicinamibacteria bacterium]